jgi:hypothetical protein
MRAQWRCAGALCSSVHSLPVVAVGHPPLVSIMSPFGRIRTIFVLWKRNTTSSTPANTTKCWHLARWGGGTCVLPYTLLLDNPANTVVSL